MGFRPTKPDIKPNDRESTAIVEDTDDPLVKQTLSFAKQKGLPTCPLAVEDVAKALGAEIIHKSDLPDHIIGRIEIDPSDSSVCRIKLNRKYNKNRLRFTVAHELGHFLKHKHWHSEDITDSDIPSAIYYNKTNKIGGEEWEANLFAAQLLMPATEIFKLKKQKATLEEMAKTFEVSKVAIKIRLEALGFLGE